MLKAHHRSQYSAVNIYTRYNTQQHCNEQLHNRIFEEIFHRIEFYFWQI